MGVVIFKVWSWSQFSMRTLWSEMFALVTSKSAEEPFTVRVCKREFKETSGGPTSDGSATGYLPLVYV